MVQRSASRGLEAANLRFPDGLRARIQSHAKANNRSMNAEIVATLLAAYPAPVEAESLNVELYQAAKAVLNSWAATLTAIGQDPRSNEKYGALADALVFASGLKRDGKPLSKAEAA